MTMLLLKGVWAESAVASASTVSQFTWRERDKECKTLARIVEPQFKVLTSRIRGRDAYKSNATLSFFYFNLIKYIKRKAVRPPFSNS
jgi:hypothetical protein